MTTVLCGVSWEVGRGKNHAPRHMGGLWFSQDGLREQSSYPSGSTATPFSTCHQQQISSQVKFQLKC